jgi:transposase
MSTRRRSTGKALPRAKSTVTKSPADGFDRMVPVIADIAGIDIGSEEHTVSVAEDRDMQPVRTFGCYTPDLIAMADWLGACGIRNVVMESTGVYWVSAFRVLEERGFNVVLVDRRRAKRIGPKTDVHDARRLRRLHTFALLQGCFLPTAEITAMRTIWRHREDLVREASTQIQRMQKALEQMNIQLHKAISDISGVTGMHILRAIVGGERNPQRLAAFREPGVKRSEAEIAKALTGHWSEEHLFTLTQALEAYDFQHVQIVACDHKMQDMMSRFPDGQPPAHSSGREHPASQSRNGEGSSPAPMKSRHARKRYPRKNEPRIPLEQELSRIFGVDLLAIEGISVMTGTRILTEIGTDVSPWPTEKHFTSWLKFAPDNRITGGKVRSSHTGHTTNRLATSLRVAAQSLWRSDSSLGAYLRRMAAKHGMAKAITATARKLAVLVYRLLRYGAEYVQRGQAEYERRYEQQQRARMIKQARRLGLQLMDTATGVLVS